MTDVRVVFVTVGSDDEATAIARALVAENFAACVNIIPKIRSIYSWQGEVCDDEERLLIIKTQAARYPALEERIRALHSYDVAEIIALPVTQGSPDYIRWVQENTRPA